MLGALTSLTGGGGLSSSSSASTGDQETSASYETTAGNVTIGGLTIGAKGFKFDADNPVHIVGGVLVTLLTVVGIVRLVKS